MKNSKNFIKSKEGIILKLLKFDKEMEGNNVRKKILRDVWSMIFLSTKEYTLSGIAYYTETPEEILFEIVSGHNTNPSVDFFLEKIVEIHRTVRSDLYRSLIEKNSSRIFGKRLNKLLSHRINNSKCWASSGFAGISPTYWDILTFGIVE